VQNSVKTDSQSQKEYIFRCVIRYFSLFIFFSLKRLSHLSKTFIPSHFLSLIILFFLYEARAIIIYNKNNSNYNRLNKNILQDKIP